MKKTCDYNSFLSQEGAIIYEALMDHCNAKLKMMEVDNFELSMLANSFALYAESARYCNENGVAMTFKAKKGEVDDDEDQEEDEPKAKGGQYQQIRPEYTVMKNEYANILKHSPKFGLNPGDRMKIFKGVKEKKKDPAAGLD